MITFSNYYNLLMEDLQSSLNQAKNILQNNNAGENVQNIISKLEEIYNEVQFDDEQHKQANKDSNIPALAFWFIADPNFDRIKEDYRQYVNTRSLYQKNFLINSMENLKKEISTKKLFKSSDEKLSLIKQTFSKVAETIHSQYEPVVKATDKKFVPGSTNDDVVYENDKITVYKADSKAKCIQYGAGSSLCISVKGGGNYYWSYRMGNMHHEGLGMTTYVVYWKDGSNRILIDALGDEDGPANKYSWNPITPNTDRDVKIMDLLIKYPELEEALMNNVFQFIPYGEKEKRYQYIEENINFITDSRLKTLEDYDMFIESIDGDDYDEDDDENISKRIRHDDFKQLESKIGIPSVEYLVKKYAGLGNIIDNESMNSYLSLTDKEWYFNSLIRELDSNYQYGQYFAILKRGGISIPPRMIEEYFTNFHKRDDNDEYNDGRDNAIGEFMNVSIWFNDIIWSVSTKLYNYSIANNIKPSDFFLGKNVTSELVSKVFSNFNRLYNSELPSLLMYLIEYYKRNNIQVPKILYKCILNSPDLSGKYAYRWYYSRLKGYDGGVGMPNRKLLQSVAKDIQITYNLLMNLRYEIISGKLKLGSDIPMFLVDVLKTDKWYDSFVYDIMYTNTDDQPDF
jgi:hypothetical protein